MKPFGATVIGLLLLAIYARFASAHSSGLCGGLGAGTNPCPFGEGGDGSRGTLFKPRHPLRPSIFAPPSAINRAAALRDALRDATRPGLGSGGPGSGNGPFGGPGGGSGPFGGPGNGNGPLSGPGNGNGPFGGPENDDGPFGGPGNGNGPLGGPGYGRLGEGCGSGSGSPYPSSRGLLSDDDYDGGPTAANILALGPNVAIAPSFKPIGDLCFGKKSGVERSGETSVLPNGKFVKPARPAKIKCAHGLESVPRSDQVQGYGPGRGRGYGLSGGPGFGAGAPQNDYDQFGRGRPLGGGPLRGGTSRGRLLSGSSRYGVFNSRPLPGGAIRNGPFGAGRFGNGPMGGGVYGNRPFGAGGFDNRPLGEGAFENGPFGAGGFDNRPLGRGAFGNGPFGAGGFDNRPLGGGAFGNRPFGAGGLSNGPSRIGSHRGGGLIGGPSGNGPIGNGLSSDGLLGEGPLSGGAFGRPYDVEFLKNDAVLRGLLANADLSGRGGFAPPSATSISGVSDINGSDLGGENLSFTEQEKIYNGQNKQQPIIPTGQVDPVSRDVALKRLFVSMNNLATKPTDERPIPEEALAFGPKTVPVDGQQKVVAPDVPEERLQIVDKPIFELKPVELAPPSSNLPSVVNWSDLGYAPVSPSNNAFVSQMSQPSFYPNNAARSGATSLGPDDGSPCGPMGSPLPGYIPGGIVPASLSQDGAYDSQPEESGLSPDGLGPYGAAPYGSNPHGSSATGSSTTGLRPQGAGPYGPPGAVPYGSISYGLSPAGPYGPGGYEAGPDGSMPSGLGYYGSGPSGSGLNDHGYLRSDDSQAAENDDGQNQEEEGCADIEDINRALDDDARGPSLDPHGNPIPQAGSLSRLWTLAGKNNDNSNNGSCA